MKRFPEYQRFVFLCHCYRTAKQLLKIGRFDPTNLIEKEIRKRLEKEINTVDEYFKGAVRKIIKRADYEKSLL